MCKCKQVPGGPSAPIPQMVPQRLPGRPGGEITTGLGGGEPTEIGGSVKTCRPYKCTVSADGNTMTCTRRCTTIKAGSGATAASAGPLLAAALAAPDDEPYAGARPPPSPGKGCRWDCENVNEELTICSKRCDVRAPKPVPNPF